MSRMIYCGQTLDELTDDDLLEAQRNVTWAREAFGHQHRGAAAACYDLDLEEISTEIRSRPGLSERPALPARLNPFLGVIH